MCYIQIIVYSENHTKMTQKLIYLLMKGGVCNSDLRSVGSVHNLCFWIHMHSTVVFLWWAPPCPHSRHEIAAVQRMLCDLKHVHIDIRFSEIPLFTVHCILTTIITFLSLLLREEVSSADEPDGGQSCTSE